MPSRESSLRAAVNEALLLLDAVAVENSALPGTPDVNYVEGWLELKSVPCWPTNIKVPLRVEHWTPEQKVWHLRRSRAGGETYVLLEVVNPGTCMLIRGDVAARILGVASYQELAAVAVVEWPDRSAMKKELRTLLQKLRVSGP